MTNTEMDHSSTANGQAAAEEMWSLAAEGYVENVLPMMEHFAREALHLAALPSDPHIVDVATGPGTLALLAAKNGTEVSAIDFSPGMIASLRRRAETAGLNVADVRVGDGQDLPYENDFFDGAFSIHGLVFFPDRGAGFRELHRVLRPGRRAVVSSMTSVSSQFHAAMDSLSYVLPDLPAAPGEPPLSDASALVREMSSAGFGQVTIHTTEFADALPSLSDFWRKVQGGAAYVAHIRQELGEERWAEVSQGVLRRLRETLGEGPVEEVYIAHLGVGVK